MKKRRKTTLVFWVQEPVPTPVEEARLYWQDPIPTMEVETPQGPNWQDAYLVDYEITDNK